MTTQFNFHFQETEQELHLFDKILAGAWAIGVIVLLISPFGFVV